MAIMMGRRGEGAGERGEEGGVGGRNTLQPNTDSAVWFNLGQFLNGQDQAGQKEIQNVQREEKRTPGNVMLEQRFVLKDEKWNKREQSPQGETPPS